jgi:hypothetical protein
VSLAPGAEPGARAAQHPAATRQPVFQKGMTLAAWSRDGYLEPGLDAELRRLRALGVEWIALVPRWFQAERRSTRIEPHAEWSASDESVRSAIRLARARDLRVFLKPHVDLLSEEGWRGEIAFDAEADWAAWFESYTEFALHWARLAAAEGVELFCAGVELDATRHREADWRRVIRALRAAYAGPLTWAANFDRERDIAWWDALDYAGLDAYFPLAKQGTADPAALRAAWEPRRARLREWAAEIGRPVLFTEIGYRSRAGAAVEPWE